MKISNVSYFTPIVKDYSLNGNNKKQSKNNAITQNNNELKLFAYRDYNISFTGRTPEDFYAQDFNRNNMPRTMKDYLDVDYYNRQHIPPEQMMREVFKYIEIADNFSDVKSIYPHEDLFKNLHQNNVKSRKGILSEIKVARELSDAPLLKDGNDDFGMYLLRKIFLEGKTLKEISKDFLEKDINDEYKGFITEPVKYSTLDAYGISYPKTAFWNSFINTRDEYKKFFVTLPKDDSLPGVNVPGSHKNSSTDRIAGNEDVEKPHKRRFNLKGHRRKEIERDLISKKAPDEETIKKAVVKRFGKDDPEASFIVKYMSPIMTVAADRAHLSQELKAFAEFEQEKGKLSNGRTMFERFWKHNPQMLEVFSAGVTDSIDMFEDIYGEGGLIPINTDLEKVTKNSKNQKIIDYVNPEFLELLSYTQQIETKRNDAYAQHDELQKQWDSHFIERYGEPCSEEEQVVQPEHTPANDELSFEDRLSIEAAKNNAHLYKIQNAEGETLYVTSNLDEVLNDEIKANARFLPAAYASKYVKSTKAEDFSEKFKLTLAAKKVIQELNAKNPDEELELSQFNVNNILLSDEEYNEEYYKLLKYHVEHYKLEHAARFAILDTMILGNDINITDPNIFDMPVYNLNESMVDGDMNEVIQFRSAMRNSKNLINRKYDYYSVPASKSELNKIELAMMDMLAKYDPSKSILPNQTTTELITMLKEILPYEANKDVYRLFMSYIVKENPYSKSLLQKGIPDDMKQAKFEIIMDDLLHILVLSMERMPNIVTMFNDDVYSKHRYKLEPSVQTAFDVAIRKLSFDGKTTFYTPKNAINLHNSSVFKLGFDD